MSEIDTLNELIHESVGVLVSEHNFMAGKQESDAEYISVSFHSSVFDIRIENYRREVYAYVSPPAKRDSEINLFVLLQFLCRNTDNNPASQYFSDVEDVKDAYRKQILWITKMIGSYWNEIEDFFCSPDVQDKIEKVNQYIVTSHPELFAKAK